MNYTTIVGLVMLAVIIVALTTKKLSFPIATSVIPILIAWLALGFSIHAMDKFLQPAISSMFIKTAFMLMFAMLYFNMASESGMFDTIIEKVLQVSKDKMNIYVAMVLTIIISSVAMLSANVATTYMIAFPTLVPLYKKLNLDRRYLLILTTSSIAMMGFLPWGIALATMSAFSGVSPDLLAAHCWKAALLFIPIFPFMIMYFGKLHKKNVSTIGIVETISEEEAAIEEESSNRRPKLFLVNLFILILAIVALVAFRYPAYIVFMFAYGVTAVINYPKISDQNKINGKVARSYFNLLFMLMAIAVFTGVFNSTGMTKGFVKLIMWIFPHSLVRYAHLILLACAVIVLRYLPYQIYLSLLPILIGVGHGFGLTPVQVVTPYVSNIGLGTGSSPMTGGTYVGVSMAEIDMDEYVSLAVRVQSVCNVVIIVLGLITGIYV
ncbi:SLC13 family permease [Clostridium ljungdahlii]|uniref:Citrate transporter n=1 Tax=Clostridium ljungdahlii TaxID=1538 RepID=A0A166RE88_9CLOT|nr:SLC13 family permease [Clostridium ljungdahlii]OAA90727.1 Citrate transporter [Clostridium ljungdahlii]